MGSPASARSPYPCSASPARISKKPRLIRGGGAAARFGSARGKAIEKSRGDARADKMRNVAAQSADFLDETRRDELEAVGGHQEDGLDFRVQPGIHAGHLKFVFEVGNREQPADDDFGPHRLAKTTNQVAETPNSIRSGVPFLESAVLAA